MNHNTLVCGCICVAFASVVAAQTRVEHTLVAVTDDPVPSVPGATFDGFESEGPAIGPSGHVAFRGNHLPNSQIALCSGLPGALALVAHEGAQAPGQPEGVLLDWPRAPTSVDHEGRVGFWTYLRGVGVPASQWGSFWGVSPSVEPLLREDFEVPWISPGILAGEYLAAPYLGGGTAVLSANTTASTGHGSVGIWQTAPGGLQLIARQGGSAPGMPTGAVFDDSGSGLVYRPLVNARGDTAFVAVVAGGGVEYGEDSGIWIRRTGVLSLAFRSGTPVSGFGAGVNLRFPELASFSNDGRIAFFGSLRAANGIAIRNNSTLWAGVPGDIRLVARINSQAAGAPNGVVYDSFTSTYPMLAGEFIGLNAVLGGAGVTSANDRAFFVGRHDSLAMGVREGDQVPGMPAGVAFADLSERFAMNARGQIVFQATISGPGVTSANNQGIWATDTRGVIHLVALEGTPITAVNASGVRVSLPVVRLRILADSGGEDGSPTSINAAGQVAFYVYTNPRQTNSDSAIVRTDIIEPCPADFNGDGFIDFFDFDEFVACFEGEWCPGGSSADFNSDGFVDFFDYDGFVTAFEVGC